MQSSLARQPAIGQAKPAGQQPPRPVSLTRQRMILTFRNPMAVIGMIVIAMWIVLAVIGPRLLPYSFMDLAGGPWTPPSAKHWLGTDGLGRDLFVRLTMGARLALVLPTASVIVGVLFGSLVGLVTGYFGGIVDDVVMRLMDIMMAFPMIMLYLLIIVAIGPSAVNVVIALAIGSTPGIARLVRSLAIDLKTREFISAAQMRGESSWHIMFKEILPNISGPLLVDACVRIAYALFGTGSLGFLGLGVPPPYPDWGMMINDGRGVVMMVPWAPLWPMIALSSLVIALNMIADGMRQAGWVD